MPLDWRTAAVLTGAALLRLAIFYAFPSIPDFFTAQVEVSTPISSFKRLQEGLFLYRRGVSPYDGGLFHQPPLLLVIFEAAPAPLLFLAADLLSALALKSISEQAVFNSPRAKALDSAAIAAAYLFNPFTIMACLGRSTNAFTNVAIFHAVSNAVAGNNFRAMFATALATYLSLYPALLLPPLILLCWDKTRELGKHHPGGMQFTSVMTGYWLTGLSALWLTTPFILRGSWDFVKATYGVQITVPDLTPNVGLWWYFFIEIFDSFRDFFIGVFWLHLAGYVGGLTIRLRKQPLFVTTTLLGLFAIFKPYPSISDVSLYFGFLPLYTYILPLTRYTFIAASVLLYATLLGPAFHYLWIFAGSGNANFFYAITLVWSLGLAMLVGDCVFAVLRDEWEIERPEMRGKSVRQV